MLILFLSAGIIILHIQLPNWLTEPIKDLPQSFYVYSSNIWEEAALSEPILFQNPGFGQNMSSIVALL